MDGSVIADSKVYGADLQGRPGGWPRLRSFNYIGFHRYFLTISTFRGTRSFVSDDAVAMVLAQLARTSHDERFAVIAYCLMPDHMHAVVEGTHEASEFREFVRIFRLEEYPYLGSMTGTVGEMVDSMRLDEADGPTFRSAP